MKIKTNIKLAFLVLAFAFFILPPALSLAAANFNYQPMEAVPGFAKTGDFYTYVSNIYKFGIGAIGVCAMLMIIAGGYMYITSAGNNSSMEKAKGVITDAVVGLILAMAAWLILYVINPDLVRINRISGTTPSGGTAGEQRAAAIAAGGESALSKLLSRPIGKCSSATFGPCTPLNLKNTCLASNADTFSKICALESSGGVPTKTSTLDKCKDGSSFSVGLFQINMVSNGGYVSGCNPKDIFTVNGSGSQGTCLERKMIAGSNVCVKWDCQVKNAALYTSCLKKLQDPSTNINIACQLSNNGAKLGPWAFTKSRCGF